MKTTLNRRRFGQLVAASTTYSLLPSRVLGANERINLACVGIGGRGGSIASAAHKSGLVNTVALCDVDMGSSRTQGMIKLANGAPQFKDFRAMFDKMADKIDALTIGVPDHSHFPIAILSMSLGKHVYVEKPLAHTFQECELLKAAEVKYKVVCQMGNQGHSGPNYFQFKAWTEAGIIKDVTRVIATMNNPRRWHGWKITGYPAGEEMPKTLDWDQWLGTAAYHPFSSKYHPGNWRSWYIYGDGAFGDWGPHILDTTHEFLKLGLPSKITAVKRDGPNEFIFPQATTIRFDFPARGDMPPVEITWYDGTKNRPPRPPELAEGQNLPSCGKVLYSKDLVFQGRTHGAPLTIIPASKRDELEGKLPEYQTKDANHMKNFLSACKGEEKTRSNFAVSAPLSQVFCLGCIAQRLGGELEFDRKTKQITNNKVANALLVGPPPRKGWEQFYKL